MRLGLGSGLPTFDRGELLPQTFSGARIPEDPSRFAQAVLWDFVVWVGVQAGLTVLGDFVWVGAEYGCAGRRFAPGVLGGARSWGLAGWGRSVLEGVISA